MISPKGDVLTEFILTTGRRISVTIVDLISAKRDILTEFMTTIGSKIFATIVILIKLYFSTICAPEFLVIRKLYAISANLISLSLRIINFNRNCDKRREYLKFFTEISNFGKTHFILERVSTCTKSWMFLTSSKISKDGLKYFTRIFLAVLQAMVLPHLFLTLNAE